VEPPDIQYARSGDVSIAYQVVGDGPLDLVFVPFNLSILVAWDQPVVVEFYRRLSSFSRLILLDKRGTGASDRPRSPLTLEMQMDDVRIVLDAVGSEQAALLGTAHGGQMCALYAATYPERTSALVLYNTFSRMAGTPEDHRALLRQTRDEWGTRSVILDRARHQYPSLADDEDFQRWVLNAVRTSVSPGAAVEFFRALSATDIGPVLPTIQAPTLVLYRIGASKEGLPFLIGLEDSAKQLAAAIPDARIVRVAGADWAPFVGGEVAAEVERFLTEPRSAVVPDRVLATVLFLDIVGSTEHAAALGDRAWRELLASHREVVRRKLAHFRGDEIDTAGDGFFATFDGPARAIACARAVLDAEAARGIGLRVGLHTGECERDGDKVAGIAVHIGARVASLAAPGEILVSRTVKDLVAGSELEFDTRGERELKGVPGTWELFAVRG
jgi:class 3 adenylate cyclase